MEKVMEPDEQSIVASLFDTLKAQARQKIPVTQVSYDDQGRVIALTMKHAGLSQLPVEVRRLIALQTLDLSFNQFEHVPGELVDLSSLRVLDMYGNRIW